MAVEYWPGDYNEYCLYCLWPRVGEIKINNYNHPHQY